MRAPLSWSRCSLWLMLGLGALESVFGKEPVLRLFFFASVAWWAWDAGREHQAAIDARDIREAAKRALIEVHAEMQPRQESRWN